MSGLLSRITHILFDEEGNSRVKKKNACPINIKYCWINENKKQIVIAYLRNHNTGHTLYGASIFSGHKDDLTKPIKLKHRSTATERLQNYPVYMMTSITRDTQQIKMEMRRMIPTSGVCLREWESRDYINWDANPQYAELMEGMIIDKNAITQKVKKNKQESILKKTNWVNFFWYYENKRAIVCAYMNNKNSNNVKYAASIIKFDYDKQYSYKNRVPYETRCMYRWIAYNRLRTRPIDINIEFKNLGELKGKLRKEFIKGGIKGKKLEGESGRIMDDKMKAMEFIKLDPDVTVNMQSETNG
tara:strand:+ start:928 stop:1830 length:903 start_codon:yes stop_codon:yes gene_type:complete